MKQKKKRKGGKREEIGNGRRGQDDWEKRKGEIGEKKREKDTD